MASERDQKIRQFIENELNHYPEARLSDLYKNYFQDAYGPGHMIPDTARAGAYLDNELKEAVWKDTLLWQALGVNHDYYRVNLSLVRDGVIPRQDLLEGMVESAPLARKPDIWSWKMEWAEVLSIVKIVFPALKGLADDEKKIAENLDKGNVVMHHSSQYTEAYQPHYRIIHSSVFEQWREKLVALDRKKASSNQTYTQCS